MSFINVKVPQPGTPVKAVYAALNNVLYNAEGGHRAIVFNRIEGIARTRNLPCFDTNSKESFICSDPLANSTFSRERMINNLQFASFTL
ncbi:hypothetical protein BHE74_00016449 [Ensete ventricosum]|nr:hypothetical protein GW17_00013149 [Ensete ventricosum]RWW75548.1 hypothetical protein BHE74_00016449 [Ensete ventricosum]